MRSQGLTKGKVRPFGDDLASANWQGDERQ